MSSSRRPVPFIWATWLAPLLAETNACVWSAWFRAHHHFRKVSAFNDPTWHIEHDALVVAAADGLKEDGFQVTVEVDNRFVLTSNGISLSGRPDLVAVRSDRVVIMDCKSGSRRPAHRFQLLIYMVVLPCVRPELKGRDIEGLIQYRDEFVSIPSDAVTPEFRQALRTTIHAVGLPTPPRKSPSAAECQFCPVREEDCPERIEISEIVAVTDHGLF